MAVISSIQEVEISVGSGSTSGTATISSVTTANSIVLFSYAFYGGQRQTSTIDAGDHILFGVELTNSTTVTAYRDTSNQAATVVATVIEFDSSVIDSIQSGTIATSSSSGTDTITSVNTSRSVVIHQGQKSDDTGNDIFSGIHTLSLTNSTTVTATNSLLFGSSNATLYYTVIEFASGVVDSVQEFDITIASGTSNTATITSVVTGQSCIFAGGLRPTSTSDRFSRPDHLPKVELTNSTTVTATIDTADAAYAPKIVGTVVEWNSDYIESIQRGTYTFVSSSANSITAITSVDTSKSFVQCLGANCGDVSLNPEDQFFTAEIDTATAIRFKKGTTGTTMSIPYEVVEFSDGPAAGYANNVNGVSNAAIGEVIDVLKANIDNVMGS